MALDRQFIASVKNKFWKLLHILHTPWCTHAFPWKCFQMRHKWFIIPKFSHRNSFQFYSIEQIFSNLICCFLARFPSEAHQRGSGNTSGYNNVNIRHNLEGYKNIHSKYGNVKLFHIGRSRWKQAMAVLISLMLRLVRKGSTSHF